MLILIDIVVKGLQDAMLAGASFVATNVKAKCCVLLMQVIEKALKKLKLDAMIIQQGRLSDNKASVNKDDLLSMVRYGAEMVFSGGGGTITDEDIDAIIAKVCVQVVFIDALPSSVTCGWVTSKQDFCVETCRLVWLFAMTRLADSG